jgi:hypothetical protein
MIKPRYTGFDRADSLANPRLQGAFRQDGVFDIGPGLAAGFFMLRLYGRSAR